jgi:hypothetical protein
MTRSTVRVFAVLCLAGCAGLSASAQNPAGTLKELNTLLAAACFNQPILKLSADGTLVRKNRDGTTHAFKLSDIGEIVNDVPDAQANIVLRCRDNKSCIEYMPGGVGGPKDAGKITVFTVNVNSNTDERILKLFRELQAAAIASGK